MIKQITHSQVYVLDQDEALEFYVGKLGFEVNTDADLGFMRWLTVNVPGRPEQQLLLEKPGPPAMDEATTEQVRELITKGAMGMAAIISVDDIHATYKDLSPRESSSPRSRQSASTAPTAVCATHSATTSGLGSPSRARSTCPIRLSSQPTTPEHTGVQEKPAPAGFSRRHHHRPSVRLQAGGLQLAGTQQQH